MSVSSYIIRRLVLVVPQLLAIVTVTFFLLRLLPGNPAVLIAGPAATEENVRRIEAEYGLDKPIHLQYVFFLSDLAQGNLGKSWFTANPVLTDLLQRFPATFELLSFSLGAAVVFGILLGVITARRGRGILDWIADRGTFAYALAAGAMPEFWLGLIVVYVFYFQLHVVPAPLGRIDPILGPPQGITGLFTLDSLLSLDWDRLQSSVSHLVAPVFTLGFVLIGPVMKMTRFTMVEILDSDYIRRARALGLPDRKVIGAALKNSLPPVITLVGILYGYLIGAAVLVESVFSWGGMGQYAVQSIVNADYAPLQGFVLAASLFSLIVYLIVDLMYLAIDPRIKY